ncbi:hypothetical protein ES703_55251 [subsurface metagenome]
MHFGFEVRVDKRTIIEANTGIGIAGPASVRCKTGFGPCETERII